MTYKEQLEHPLWKLKREKILERDGHRCTEPGCYSKVRLEVHHTYYIKKALAWQYPDSALKTLCRKHHQARHGKGKVNGKVKFLANRREYYKQKAVRKVQSQKL